MQTSAIPFIPTHAVLDAWEAMDRVVATVGMGLVKGEPGSGKTAMLRAYATDRGRLLLYRGEVMNTPRSMIQALLQQLGVVWNGGTRVGFMVLRHLVAEVGCRAVLVDDVQRLSRSTLDMLRAIHEGTGMAIVLVGTAAVGRKLVRIREELAHHVTIVHELASLTLDDVLAFVRAGHSRKRRTYWECVAMARTLLRTSGGNFRRLVQVMAAAKRLARVRHRASAPHFVDLAATAFQTVA